MIIIIRRRRMIGLWSLQSAGGEAIKSLRKEGERKGFYGFTKLFMEREKYYHSHSWSHNLKVRQLICIFTLVSSFPFQSFVDGYMHCIHYVGYILFFHTKYRITGAYNLGRGS